MARAALQPPGIPLLHGLLLLRFLLGLLPRAASRAAGCLLLAPYRCCRCCLLLSNAPRGHRRGDRHRCRRRCRGPASRAGQAGTNFAPACTHKWALGGTSAQHTCLPQKNVVLEAEARAQHAAAPLQGTHPAARGRPFLVRRAAAPPACSGFKCRLSSMGAAWHHAGCPRANMWVEEAGRRGRNSRGAPPHSAGPVQTTQNQAHCAKRTKPNPLGSPVRSRRGMAAEVTDG